MQFVPQGFHGKLDPSQIKAATCGLGPVRCNAGAGSGKTATYAHRIAFLKANGFKEENIMATTFTKKAANEMKDRINKVCQHNEIDIDLKKMMIGTFHSLGIRFCREFCHIIDYSPDFTIIDDDDQEDLIKKIMRESPIFKDTKGVRYKDIVFAISYARNAGEDYLSVFERKLYNFSNHVALVDIAEEYERKKREMQVFDFDDMMIYWLDILTKSPSARKSIQDRVHYMLVDEYQDTNHIQNEIIDIIAGERRNLFVVGDDWQSIYAFRAAQIRNIIDFDRRYPECKTFLLANNYRSTPEIVALSSACIAHNSVQLKKDVEAPNRSIKHKPSILRANDELHQARHIVKLMKKMHAAGVPYKDMAVIYRNNAMSVMLEKELNKYFVPYAKKGGDFWKSTHIKLCLSWIKLLQNPLESSCISRCLNMIKGVGTVAINKFVENVKTEDDFFSFLDGDLIVDEKAPQAYEEFRKTMVNLESIIGDDEKPVEAAMRHVTSTVAPFIAGKYDAKEGGNRVDDLEVLIAMAEQFEDLPSFLEAIALQEERKSKRDRDEVTLTTGHGSKGLEWDNVFVIGLLEDVFPSKYVTTDEELEEERRLFYVMITRAAKRLYMFAPKAIKQYGKTILTEPSMFLLELLHNHPDLVDERFLKDIEEHEMREFSK